MEDSHLHALLLGALQGITEFLPVSSSGHLILVSWFMDGKPLPLTLNIALHIGTLGAVLLYFWRDWLALAKGALARLRGTRSFESDVLLPGLLVGSIPAGVIGVLWQDEIEALFHNPLTVCFPLAFVGFLLWGVDVRRPQGGSIRSLGLKDAFLIGLAQAAALIPGVSRSGATIIGGRLRGLSRDEAARFSFLLGTPAMGGAALLNADELLASASDPVFYLGVLASLVVGLLTIRFFLNFLKSYGFSGFAWYRLALALAIAALMIATA